MTTLRPFSQWRLQKMAQIAAVCGYDRCSSYLTGYLETTSIGMNMTKGIVLTWMYIFMNKLWSQRGKNRINGLSNNILKCWFWKISKLKTTNFHRLALIFYEFPIFTSNYMFLWVTKLNRLLLSKFNFYLTNENLNIQDGCWGSRIAVTKMFMLHYWLFLNS